MTARRKFLFPLGAGHLRKENWKMCYSLTTVCPYIFSLLCLVQPCTRRPRRIPLLQDEAGQGGVCGTLLLAPPHPHLYPPELALLRDLTRHRGALFHLLRHIHLKSCDWLSNPNIPATNANEDSSEWLPIHPRDRGEGRRLHPGGGTRGPRGLK